MDYENGLFEDSLWLVMCAGMYLNTFRTDRRWAVRPINRTPMISKAQFLYFRAMRNDPQMFRRYTRMSTKLFDELLSRLTPRLKGKTRRAIPPELKLALALQYLTQGTTKIKESWTYEIGASTVGKVVDEVCQALIDVVMPEVLARPTRKDWLEIAAKFEERWNVPNALGAVDGKHILVQKPKKSGSQYLNYKRTFSTVLMATVDADYRFRVVDVGSCGGEHDAGVFRATDFGDAILNDALEILQFPAPRRVPGMRFLLPYFLLADDAFPLRINMFKPYGGRLLPQKESIFNYRISRGRRVVESAFGILAARFRIFKTPIIATPERVENYVLAAVTLHNLLLMREGNLYIPQGYADTEDDEGNLIPGKYRDELSDNEGFQPQPPTRSRNSRQEAIQVRDMLADWFVSPIGSLPWQENFVYNPKRKRN